MPDTTAHIVRRACERGILPWRPQFGTTTIILIDDDGLVVSMPISHGIMDEEANDLTVVQDAFDRMLDERRRLRGKV